MSSALRCPLRIPYGVQERRRSRNMAACGMFGMMSLLMAAGVMLHAERTLSLPSVEARRVFMVQAQFRTVPPPEEKQPDMEKILTQESDFLVPEQPEPVVEKKPEPVKPEPEVRPVPEPETKPVVKPEPERRPAPKPKAKKPPRPAPKAEAALPAPEGKAAENASSVSAAAASVPEAVGSEKAESDRRSAVLAGLLQAVEKHKRYPRQGRRSGAEGTCTLMVQIGADGRVVSCSLAEASGRTVLDAAARRLGEKLVGFDVGSSGALRVLIPVHYRLTDR